MAPNDAAHERFLTAARIYAGAAVRVVAQQTPRAHPGVGERPESRLQDLPASARPTAARPDREAGRLREHPDP